MSANCRNCGASLTCRNCDPQSPAQAMLPEPVECGTPCGTCEALAHEAARLREEAATAKINGGMFAELCEGLENDNARLREELDRQRNHWQRMLPDELAHKSIAQIDVALAGEVRRE